MRRFGIMRDLRHRRVSLSIECITQGCPPGTSKVVSQGRVNRGVVGSTLLLARLSATLKSFEFFA
jgi:hypothetical protein